MAALPSRQPRNLRSYFLRAGPERRGVAVLFPRMGTPTGSTGFDLSEYILLERECNQIFDFVRYLRDIYRLGQPKDRYLPTGPAEGPISTDPPSRSGDIYSLDETSRRGMDPLGRWLPDWNVETGDARLLHRGPPAEVVVILKVNGHSERRDPSA